MKSASFEIIGCSTDWGVVETHGRLGFPCDLSSEKIVYPKSINFEGTISAHANSEVKVLLKCPHTLMGFMSGTSSGQSTNPVQFTVNYNTLGTLGHPLETTQMIELPAGIHNLRCHCGTPSHGRHSAWGLNSFLSGYVPSRLAVLTVGRYPPSELHIKLRNFTKSLTRVGLTAEICGSGEPMRGWYLDKIVDLRNTIELLPAHYTHILFSDGSDSFILKGEQDIIDDFNQFGADFVISMERGCWPVCDPEWVNAFPSAIDNRRWPNAGGWIGTREGVKRVLDQAILFHDKITKSGLEGKLSRWQKFAEHVEDDQWLLQLVFLSGEIPMAPDIQQYIFTNVGTASHKIIENPDYELSPGSVFSIASKSYPSVIHFSGGTWQRCGIQWMAQLGIT